MKAERFRRAHSSFNLVTIRLQNFGRERAFESDSYESAYPSIPIFPRSRNWWAWLKGSPAECIHLEHDSEWVADASPRYSLPAGKASGPEGASAA